MVGIDDLDAVCLTVLYAGRELSCGKAVCTEVALIGQYREIGILPFLWRIFPRAYLIELDSKLPIRKIVLYLTCQFT